MAIRALRSDLEIPLDRNYSLKALVRNKTTKAAVDISSYTITASIRASRDQDSTSIADFTIDDSEASSGIFYRTLTAAVLDAVTAQEGWYDVVFTDGSSLSETWIWGKVKFIKFPTQVT